jgi:hypothetical protein
MKKVIALLIFILVNIIGGVILWKADTNGYFIFWTKIPSPEGVNKELSIYQEGNIILQVDKNKYLWTKKDWEIIIPNQEDYRQNTMMEYCKERETNYGPKPPFQPIDEIARWCGGPEWGVVERIAISRELEVWEWKQSFSLFDPIGTVILCSIILFVEIISIIVVLLIRNIRLQRKNSSPNPRLEPTWPSARR